MFAGKRIVVTGGTGFLGSFLAEELLRRGASLRVPTFAPSSLCSFGSSVGRPPHQERCGFLVSRKEEIEWMKGDLRDEAFCRQLLTGADRLFHLASRRKNVAVHREKAGEIAADNIRMSLALSSAVAEHPIPVTFVSSATVPEPLSLLSLADAPEADGYALGKAACEILWLTASRQHHFPLLTIRPVGIYGPRDVFSVEGNVIPSLMIKAESAADTLEVWGSGRAVRSFLYVEDVASALLVLAEGGKAAAKPEAETGAAGIQHLASPETVTVRSLAERIRDLVRPGLPLHFDTSKPEGSLSPRFPPLHASLKDFRWTSLGEGLKKTLEWWRMHH